MVEEQERKQKNEKMIENEMFYKHIDPKVRKEQRKEAARIAAGRDPEDDINDLDFIKDTDTEYEELYRTEVFSGLERFTYKDIDYNETITKFLVEPTSDAEDDYHYYRDAAGEKHKMTMTVTEIGPDGKVISKLNDFLKNNPNDAIVPEALLTTPFEQEYDKALDELDEIFEKKGEFYYRAKKREFQRQGLPIPDTDEVYEDAVEEPKRGITVFDKMGREEAREEKRGMMMEFQEEFWRRAERKLKRRKNIEGYLKLEELAAEESKGDKEGKTDEEEEEKEELYEEFDEEEGRQDLEDEGYDEEEEFDPDNPDAMKLEEGEEGEGGEGAEEGAEGGEAAEGAEGAEGAEDAEGLPPLPEGEDGEPAPAKETKVTEEQKRIEEDLDPEEDGFDPNRKNPPRKKERRRNPYEGLSSMTVPDFIKPEKYFY